MFAKHGGVAQITKKIAISEAIRFKQESLNELVHKYYGHPEWPSLYDFFSHSKVHGGTPEAKAQQ